MRFVLDSSVIAKLFYEEDGTELMRTLMSNSEKGKIELIASDLVFFELGNIVWKCDRRGFRVPDLFFEKLYSLDIDIDHMDNGIAGDALSIAIEAGITFYDGVHIATGRKNDSPIVTEDRKLLAIFEDAIPLERSIDICSSIFEGNVY